MSSENKEQGSFIKAEFLSRLKTHLDRLVSEGRFDQSEADGKLARANLIEEGLSGNFDELDKQAELFALGGHTNESELTDLLNKNKDVRNN